MCTMNDELHHPSRKVLLVVTTGGFTHASPVFEIGRALAERGHAIEFATLDGQESWTKDYDFVDRVHLLGAGPTDEQLDAHYRRSGQWDMSKGISQAMESKYMFDSFWPQTYHGLKEIMENAHTRPGVVIADTFVDAAKDIHFEFGLPIAMVGPSMPYLMMPCSYIPGQPGFQLEGTTTSEHASLWLRIKNELVVFTALKPIIELALWTRRMRRQNGVLYTPPKLQKPDYLVFVNSFAGLEIPRDLPPTCAPVGPLLSPTYPPLDDACETFLTSHQKIVYIALGTHVILSDDQAAKIMNGIIHLMQDGLIDGVIWAIGKSPRQDIDPRHVYCLPSFSGNPPVDQNSMWMMRALMDGKHQDWLFPHYAPQRAILDHPSTILYFTHGGGSSANEGLYHGKPMLSMGFFFDQIQNTSRLVETGVAKPLNKFRFTSDEVYKKACCILRPGAETGNVAGGGGASTTTYQRNALRLMRIARVASRRKYHAADLVEEMVYDHELRFSDDGRQLQPMHLQTADMRMPLYKARNWDLYAVCGLSAASTLGAVTFGLLSLWRTREVLAETGRDIFMKTLASLRTLLPSLSGILESTPWCDSISN